MNCYVYSFTFDYVIFGWLTHKEMEMHGCIISTVSTDVLLLKCQTINTHSAY